MGSYGLERRISTKARGALARYEDIRKDRTRRLCRTTREQDASVQPDIGE